MSRLQRCQQRESSGEWRQYVLDVELAYDAVNRIFRGLVVAIDERVGVSVEVDGARCVRHAVLGRHECASIVARSTSGQSSTLQGS